jgi:nonribosomal peptide synthetase DhbF
MVPARVTELAEFPLTGSGKIDTRALERLLPDPGPADVDGADPLVGWWTATLGRLLGRPVGPDTDFFAAGGHSLLAARALAQARAELGVDLRVRQLFATPTARELAEASLDAAEAALGAALAPEASDTAELVAP